MKRVKYSFRERKLKKLERFKGRFMVPIRDLLFKESPVFTWIKAKDLTGLTPPSKKNES